MYREKGELSGTNWPDHERFSANRSWWLRLFDHGLYLFLKPVVYGAAAQQALEILYTLPFRIVPVRQRKLISKLFTLLSAFSLEMTMGGEQASFVRREIEAGLVGLLSCGLSEAINGGLKSLVYAKEWRKANAAEKLSQAGSISLEEVARK